MPVSNRVKTILGSALINTISGQQNLHKNINGKIIQKETLHCITLYALNLTVCFPLISSPERYSHMLQWIIHAGTAF